ncbi:MAG: NCS2 family permease [Floccifex sp.]
MEKYFKLNEKGSNVKTEILAGITTFLAMAYILGVNPSVLSASGMSPTAVFTATAISAGFASILMGLLANYPVALAPGMGVNALFAYTVCGAMGYSWQAALAAVFISGVIFVVISVTGIRKAIINAIPVQMKFAIGAGIGFFIAFIGFKNAAIIVSNEATFVGIGNLTDPTVLLALFGLLVTIALVVKKVPAAVFVGMVVTAVIGIVLGFMGIEGMPVVSQVASLNFDFSATGQFVAGFGELFAHPFQAVVILFSFLFVDFFDTAGTLISIGNNIGLVNKKGELENGERALLADAVGTVAGAALGTSTVTSFVESTSGVGVGGRTGLTAITTGVLFLLATIFSPFILSIATNAVTAPALIVVGIMMAQQLGNIEWNDMVVAAAAFTTVIMMVLMYSISDGIACGFIVYTIGMLASGRSKEMNPIIYALDILFIIYFISLCF